MPWGVVLQLVGETIRELGTLAVLFVPLDSVMSERPLDTRVLIGWIAGSGAVIVCGILLEAKNR